MTRYVGKHRMSSGKSTHRGVLKQSQSGPLSVATLAATVAVGVGPASAMATTLSGGATPALGEPNRPTLHTGKMNSGTPPRQTRATVTRYTASSGYRINIRSAPTLRTPGSIAGKLPNGTPLQGRFISSGLWFHVTEGRWAGHWVVASLVHDSPHSQQVNGLLDQRKLVPIPRGSARRGGGQAPLLARPTAHAFANMNAAFKARFGHDLGILEGYRSLAVQKIYAQRFGYPRAAIPGTSNHGLGNAIDVCEIGRAGKSSPYFFGHAYDRWLSENGWKWGFDRPTHLDAGGSNPEYWHYNFVG